MPGNYLELVVDLLSLLVWKMPGNYLELVVDLLKPFSFMSTLSPRSTQSQGADHCLCQSSLGNRLLNLRILKMVNFPLSMYIILLQQNTFISHMINLHFSLVFETLCSYYVAICCEPVFVHGHDIITSHWSVLLYSVSHWSIISLVSQWVDVCIEDTTSMLCFVDLMNFMLMSSSA